MTVIKGKFGNKVTYQDILDGIEPYNIEHITVLMTTKEGDTVLAYSEQNELTLLGQIEVAKQEILLGYFQ